MGGNSLGVPPGTFDRHGGVIGLGGNPSILERPVQGNEAYEKRDGSGAGRHKGLLMPNPGLRAS